MLKYILNGYEVRIIYPHRIFDTEDDGRIPVKDFRKAMEELGEPLQRSFTFQLFPLILKHQFLCLSHQFKCLSRQFKCLSHQFKCLSKQFKCLSHQLNDMLRAADPYKEGSIRYRGNYREPVIYVLAEFLL